MEGGINMQSCCEHGLDSKGHRNPLKGLKERETPSMIFSFHCREKGARMSKNQSCSNINQAAFPRNEQLHSGLSQGEIGRQDISKGETTLSGKLK